jgi:hypothetical protein
MRQLLLVTVRALGDAGGSQEVMCAAVGSTARRVAPFRIRHGSKFLSSLRVFDHDHGLVAGAEHPLIAKGIDSSGLDPATKSGQRFPAGVTWTLFAVTGLAVTVSAATRAKSFAVRLAQCSDRQGQKHLLAQNIFKRKTVFLIITDFCFWRWNRAFPHIGIGLDWPKD